MPCKCTFQLHCSGHCSGARILWFTFLPTLLSIELSIVGRGPSTFHATLAFSVCSLGPSSPKVLLLPRSRSSLIHIKQCPTDHGGKNHHKQHLSICPRLLWKMINCFYIFFGDETRNG